jgi:hypothetical protein
MGGTPAEDMAVERCAGEPPLDCHMTGHHCAAEFFARVRASDFDESGWTRLEHLAQRGVVGLRRIDREPLAVIDSCRLPGTYHEAAAHADSPGRGWAADRLIFAAEEITGCGEATHAVAAFGLARGGSERGAAVVVPLPCPPLDRADAPPGCVGAGLAAHDRKERARTLHEAAVHLLHASGTPTAHRNAASLLFDVAALAPGPVTAANLARGLAFLRTRSQRDGGCFVLAEARWRAHALDPSFSADGFEPGSARPALSRETLDCMSRPSFLTCFPEVFIPGTGKNCW